MVLKIPYVYDVITQLCRQRTEVVQNYVSANVRNTGKSEAMQGMHKRLKLGGGQAYDR